MNPDQPTLQLDHVILSLEAAIDAGAWKEEPGICGHCFDVGIVYAADPDLTAMFSPDTDPTLVCKECLVHRALWKTYLQINP